MAQDTQIVCPEIDECKEVTPALIKHIMVPFDASEISYHAFELALDLAKKYHAKISVLTVMHSNALSSSFLMMPIHDRILEHDRVAKMDRIFKLLKDIAKKFGIPLSADMMFSPTVADSILSFANRHKVNVIIMGTRSRTGPKDFLIGSVAVDVIQKAACPVILVR
jgi:nucleotide-binding universal stress UspA family protein